MIFFSYAAVEYIREAKVLPGLPTFVACCNVPINESITIFL